MNWHLLIFAALVTASLARAGDAVVSVLVQKHVFVSGQDSCHTCRIPSLLVTPRRINGPVPFYLWTTF
jgi:hypothetical protein